MTRQPQEVQKEQTLQEDQLLPQEARVRLQLVQRVKFKTKTFAATAANAANESAPTPKRSYIFTRRWDSTASASRPRTRKNAKLRKI